LRCCRKYVLCGLMNVFAIGDLHLSFSVGEAKSMDMFGDAWVNHTEKLKENWLRLVNPDDIVVLPGDFSWAMKLEEAKADFDWLSHLPGRKIFVRGNHDLWWSSLKKMQTLYPEVHFIQNDSIVVNGIAIAGSRGWINPDDLDFKESTDGPIYQRERLRFEMSLSSIEGEYSKLIFVSHFPPLGFTDILKKYNVDYAIYGHLHGEKAFANGPVGLIDGTEYFLCSLDKLKAVPQLICKV